MITKPITLRNQYSLGWKYESAREDCLFPDERGGKEEAGGDLDFNGHSGFCCPGSPFLHPVLYTSTCDAPGQEPESR